nr:hypothetical protein [Mucilaginibacter sp. FT3.2]
MFISVAANSQIPKHHYSKSKKTNLSTPANTARGYLEWYLNSRGRLNRIGFIDSCGKEKFYCVNFDEVDRYLLEFKKSGYVSDLYISKLRDYFEKIAWELEKYPRKDVLIHGFEADFILNIGMEEGNFENDLRHGKFECIRRLKDLSGRNLAIVLADIGTMHLKLIFTLSKYAGRWHIMSYQTF